MEVFAHSRVTANGGLDRTISNYEEWADRIMTVPGVVRAAPLVKGQVMANRGQYNAGVEVFGIAYEDILTIPRIVEPESSAGALSDFESGVAIGSGVAAELNVGIGDKIKIISPNGVKTAFGTSPRVNAYEVTYIFTAGRWDIDRTRVYLPSPRPRAFSIAKGWPMRSR